MIVYKRFLFVFLFTLTTFSFVIAQNAEKAKGSLVIPEFVQKPVRTPKYPLKTKRMIYTEDQLSIARNNITQYSKAKTINDDIIKAANVWLSWEDNDLRALLADARVPRAFDLNSNGCPEHGAEVFNKGGAYPWIIDASHPFKVKCPVGGEIYPSNDYESYYNSDFKEKKGWDTEYVDDGWGWVAPDGERYWFVAHSNHWLWHKTINPGILNLSQAYLLTGDKRYAHKAAVMLVKLAETYPSMDHANQSRYGLMSKAENRVYPGKVVNYIWETGFIQNVAQAYDAIWDSIDEDKELQKLYGKSGEQVRSLIEANLFEEALDSYFDGKIRGNFGMHQSALLYILLARQNMDTEKYINMIVDEPGTTQALTGLRYALYNQIFRDGMALESPGYNLIWVDRFALLSELLERGGIDLFKDPRVKMLLDGPLKVVASGRYTIDWGDTGSTIGAVAGRNPNTYQIAYGAYQDPKYLQWLGSNNYVGENSFWGFESLFRKPLPKAEPLPGNRAVAIQPSRLFAGYGLGVLNNKKDDIGIAFTYGAHFQHYHWDFLNFELFANGQKMMPDLGYPDAMNAYVKEVYSWSSNTIAHNTVVVDAAKQNTNPPGVLHDFSESDFVRSMDASSPAYSQTSQYRRNLIMVDVSEYQSYVVDFFRVAGGKQHDYSLHGPPGMVSTVGGSWGDKQKGTFAGENVQLGEIYDNSQLGAKDYSGGYGGYRGSGYQHLFNVQKLNSGSGLLEYAHVRDQDAKLRIHLLSPDAQAVFMADAYDKPRAKDHVIKYLIAQRKVNNTGDKLKSTFISVLEPFKATSFVKGTKLLSLKSGEGSAVEVERDGFKDIVVSDTKNSLKKLADYQLETDANSAVVTLDSKGKVTRVFFSSGSFLTYKGKRYKAESIKGTVTDIDVNAQKVRVKLASNNADVKMKSKVAHFTNEFRTTVHPLINTTKQGDHLEINIEDALLVGKVRMDAAKDKAISTSTFLPFARLYSGVTLLDKDFNSIGLLEKVERRQLVLSQKPSIDLKSGEDIWFSNLGVGDEMEIKSVFSWTIN